MPKQRSRSVRKGIEPLKKVPSKVRGEVASLRRMGRKGRALSGYRQEQVKRSKVQKRKIDTPKGKREKVYSEDEVERFFKIQFTFFGAQPWRLFEEENGRLVENHSNIARAKTAFAKRVGRAVSRMYSHQPVHRRAKFLGQTYHFFEKFRFGDQRDYILEQLSYAPAMQVPSLSLEQGYRTLAEITEAAAEEARAKCLELHLELPKSERNKNPIGPYGFGLLKYFLPEVFDLSNVFHSSKFRLFSESREGMVVNKKRAAEFRAGAVERFIKTFELAYSRAPERDREHFLRGVIGLSNTMAITGRNLTKKEYPALEAGLKRAGKDHWWNEEFTTKLWDEVSSALKQRAKRELKELKNKN